MKLYESLISKDELISVIGLGYVGIPLAVALAKKFSVIGFDTNSSKIDAYLSGIDPTGEVGSRALTESSIDFTSDESQLRRAKFHIVAVPTPINQDKRPDLLPVETASRIVGRNLVRGSVVVFESTVYPGVTESICVPILEIESGLKYGIDFSVGYSPERINPGDKKNKIESIVKIVSGCDQQSMDTIANVYETIITAGVFRASSIKVAEAAKVVENSQRDINIAFMNEIAMIFDKMGIDTMDVVHAMNTKWNALKFYPGLVGGHCIGVDPYYFIYEAEKLGYHSQIILSGRKINDGMAGFVASSIIKRLIVTEKKVKDAKVVIFGVTFKENVPDARNSKVYDLIRELREYEIEPIIVDPVAHREEIEHEYGLGLTSLEDIRDADCLVFAVAHEQFKNLNLHEIDSFYKDIPNSSKVLFDIKGLFNRHEVEQFGYSYWRL